MGVALREDLPGAGRGCFRERARQPRGDLAVEGGWMGGWVEGGLREWHEKGKEGLGSTAGVGGRGCA